MASKCLLYADWLTTLGGGERYLFALADALASDNDIVVAAPELPPLERMAALGFPTVFEMREVSRASLPTVTGDYDLFVNLTTRLPMPSSAGASFAVVQFPVDSAGAIVAWRHPKSRLRVGSPRKALAGYRFLTYSEYSKAWLHHRWGVEAEVLRPPLLTGDPPALDTLLSGKGNRILSVARFFGDGSMKRQDVLIEAFKSLPADLREVYQLVLAGVVARDASSRDFVESLRRKAAGYNVSFALDQSPADLERLYRSSTLFWHAAGYGRPANRPDLAEHFGMVTVEAMSRAVVPLVYGDGGQEEVVRQAGGVWHRPEELVSRTVALLEDDGKLNSDRRGCYESALSYSYERFVGRARQVVLDPTCRPGGRPA